MNGGSEQIPRVFLYGALAVEEQFRQTAQEHLMRLERQEKNCVGGGGLKSMKYKDDYFLQHKKKAGDELRLFRLYCAVIISGQISSSWLCSPRPNSTCNDTRPKTNQDPKL